MKEIRCSVFWKQVTKINFHFKGLHNLNELDELYKVIDKLMLSPLIFHLEVVMILNKSKQVEKVKLIWKYYVATLNAELQNYVSGVCIT